MYSGDAETMRRRIFDPATRAIAVCGGSYTGVEAVTQIQCALRRAGRTLPVILLNHGERTCRQLPSWMGRYIEANLERLRIEVRHHLTLDGLDGDTAVLSNGETLEHCLAVWTAGVRVPDVAATAGFPATPDGRLITDASLRLGERAYAAGDTAAFVREGKPARMSVQFAIMSGRAAARNTLRELAGRRPQRFRPLDLGYIVPMANFRGCGIALGVPVRGAAAMLLHYTMCLYRTPGFRPRFRLARALCRAAATRG